MHMSSKPKPGSKRSNISDTTDFGGFLAILRRNRSKIALATLASTGLALLYLATAAPQYTVSASLFVDPRTRKIVSEEIIQGSTGSDFALVESQVSILSSDTVLRRVVGKMSLATDPEFAPVTMPGPMQTVKQVLLNRPLTSDPETKAVISLSERLKVKRAQKTYVIDLDVTASTPEKAKALAEAVIAAYFDDQKTAKSQEARRANALSDSRLDELREQVRRAEIRIDEFKRANKILTSEGGVVGEQQLTRLNGELITARAVAAESKARLDQITGALKSGAGIESLPDSVKSGLVQKLREQGAQVARREAALSSQLQDRHPDLVEVRSQLRELKSQIAAELKRVAEASRGEHQVASKREREITKTLDGTKSEVARTDTGQIKLRELEQEANTSRELMRVFLARAKETQEQQNLATLDARVISEPALPLKPSHPMTWLILPMGLLGGLGLGIAAAFWTDHFDNTVRTAGEIAERSGLRLLGTIPPLKQRSFGYLFPVSKPGATASADADATDPTARASPYSDLLNALADGRTPQALHYRQSVTRLLNRIRSAIRPGRPAVVLFTAPHTGAGTSATALSVAYAAALGGERTLLVDASSRDAVLSGVFAARTKADQIIVLDNREHLANLVTKDSRSGLAFLPIALADLRTLRATQRRRLVQGLNGLSQSYDLVIIDAGSMLEDDSGLSLLPAADQVIVVARTGVTDMSQISDATELLEAVNDRIFGVVLTMAEPEAA